MIRELNARAWLPPVLLALAVSACGNDPAPSYTDPAPPLDELASEYLFLELSMGLHDPAHVDAYFGPEEIRTAAESAALELDEIRIRARELSAALRSAEGDAGRIAGLLARLTALDARIDLAQGKTPSFDEEAERLFGLRAPDHDAAHFDAILAEIEVLLPGDGDLSSRVNDFRSRFEIPPEKIPSNIGRFGNTSAATIGILTDELRREGKIQQGDLLCFLGIGAGLNWGVALMRL